MNIGKLLILGNYSLMQASDAVTIGKLLNLGIGWRIWRMLEDVGGTVAGIIVPPV